jgi:kynureninase
MEFKFEADFARAMDESDPLAPMRSNYLIPKHSDGSEVIYFTGNSLGLQPAGVRSYLEEEMEDWASHGVEGHFDARRPWMPYHELFSSSLARLVGANPSEVVAMNGLTANLHFMMVSFYRPTKERYKILCEAKAFPSDQYALESQVRFHGFDPEDAIIEVSPREGEHTLREEDIFRIIEERSDEIALIMFGGVNYYTGQRLPMKDITKLGHSKGITVGFDLAHAMGNVELQLHDWGVDFAAWCSYKYLNSGPGSISGVFVHERHHENKELVRFAGWWGHNKERRFLMEKGFDPIPSAEAWQLSNAPVFAMAPHRAALDLFDAVELEDLFNKRDRITAYLEYVIHEVARLSGADFEIITPKEKDRRGSQISLLTHGHGKALFDKLTAAGVIADWREPNVIRMAPVPMYVSYTDIYRFGQILLNSLSHE